MKKNNESFFKLKSNDEGDGNGNENGNRFRLAKHQLCAYFFLHFFAFFARLRRNAPINVNPVVGGGGGCEQGGFDKC